MTKHIFRVPVDTKHFEDTIIKGKSSVLLASFLTSEELEQLPKSGRLIATPRYWGSLPGASNSKTFEQMEAGDEILFYRSGKYIGAATVAYKTVNPELARYSWGEAKNGTTWELVYFLRDVTALSLDAHKLNEQWGLKPGPVMGFSKLSDERVQPWLEKHGSVAHFLSEQKVAA